jgi:hypothetical protein
MDEKQAIYMVDDGQYAWEVKNFLIKQERCESVQIDSKTYQGLYHQKKDKSDL